MKLVSWNVNGLRAVLGKGMADAVDALEPDVLCLQEIKARPEQVKDLWISSWPHQLWNPAEKAGYSGVLILSRVRPLSTSVGIGWPEHDREGRVCTMEFEGFYLVNCYTPNSQNELVRLPYREQWDAAFREYVAGLAETKPVVFCGDLNVAHEEIDIARPKENRFSAGFSDQERAGTLDGLVVLTASVLLAWVLTRLVDAPIRRSAWLEARPWRALTAVAASFALVAGTAMGWSYSL